MQKALKEARLAAESGEVPVGAVIVKSGKIIASAHNLCESGKNPLFHAEMLAISEALENLSAKRLDNCDLYVTLEPCVMCCGAIVHARISRVFFGAYDKLFGGVVSKAHCFNPPIAEIEYYCGIMEDECSEVLTDFFNNLRK